MKELPDDRLQAILTERAASTLWIIAPNYEPRSTRQVTLLAGRLVAENWPGRLLVLQFSAAQHVAALESLKVLALSRIAEVIPQRALNRMDKRISYPAVIQSVLKRQLEEAVASLEEPYRVVIEITAIPRRIIRLLLESMPDQEHTERFVTYTWAASYPSSPRPAATGSLVGLFDGAELSDIWPDSTVSEAAVLFFPGRQGFDSGQLVDVARRKHASISILSFFDWRDPLLSLESMRANASLLHAPDARVVYYFSIEQAAELVQVWAEEKIAEGRELLLLAPFGPKPLMVLCWTVMKRIREESTASWRWDIVSLRQAEPNSLYSIGYRRSSVFQL